MIGLIDILLGIGLLVAGRKLFWLFVAAAGFVLGAQIVIRSLNGPEWLGVVVGIVVGLVFAALAVFVRSAAIGIAGFIAGASIVVGLAELFTRNTGGFSWLLYIVGGILGIVLVMLLFNWALITLSSLGGAALLSRELAAAGVLPPSLAGVVFVILAILGVIIQAVAMSREKRHA